MIPRENIIGHAEHIGIWKLKKKGKDAYYIRNPALYKEYSEWAWTLSFPLIKTSRRIVYIGDSVGMGYYYKPFFTPAMYLQELLTNNLQDTEVIDLSHKGLDYQRLKDLVMSSVLLNPDALVLFLGEELWKLAAFFDSILGFLERLQLEYGISITLVLPVRNRFSLNLSSLRHLADWKSGDNKLALVDLHELWKAQEKGALQEEYFLDTSHLSVFGIQAAMQQIAIHVSSPVPKEAGEERKMINTGYKFGEQENMIRGRAYLIAAIECGQKESLPYQELYKLCQNAIRYWPDAIRAFRLYLELATSAIPWYLHRNYTELSKFDLWPVFPKKSQLIGSDQIRLNLVNAMVNALKSINIDLSKKTDRDWLEGYGSIDGRINLLEHCYRKLEYSHGDLYPGLPYEECLGYYPAFVINTQFYLPVDEEQEIKLKLTLCCEAAKDEKASIKILLEQVLIAEIPAAKSWSDVEITLTKEMYGKNRIQSLEIIWPDIKMIQKQTLSGGNRLEGHIPVYGRIMRCEAITGAKSQIRQNGG